MMQISNRPFVLSDAQAHDILIRQAIASDDLEGLEKLLEKLPLEDFDDTRYYNFLRKYLMDAYLNKRSNVVKVLFKVWRKADHTDTDKNKLDLFTSLFLNPIFPLEMLKFIIPTQEDYSLYSHLDNLINFDERPQVFDAARKLRALYDDLDNQQYKDLYQIAIAKENQILQRILIECIEETSPFSTKPNWVKNFFVDYDKPLSNKPTFSGTIPYEDELLIPDIKIKPPPPESLSTDQVVDRLTQGLLDIGLGFDDIEVTKTAWRKLLEKASEDKKYNEIKEGLILYAKASLEDDPQLFRLLGPCNVLQDKDLDDDSICSKYGGCRMFLCNQMETLDEDFDVEYDETPPQIDWFTGYCDGCHIRIPNRYYAIRRPLSEGSWQGCYHSFECLRKDMDEFFANDFKGAVMVDLLEKQIQKYGIQDRLIRPQKDEDEESENEDEEEEELSEEGEEEEEEIYG